MQQKTRFSLVKHKRAAGRLAARFNLPSPHYCKVFNRLTNQDGNPCWVWQLAPKQQHHLAPFISNRLANVLCAFITAGNQQRYAITWWQNGTQVKRCGHGTLATAALTNTSRAYFKSNIEVINANRKANGQHEVYFAPAPMQIAEPQYFPYQFGPTINAVAESNLGYTLIELADCQLGQLDVDINALKAATSNAVILLAFNNKKQRWQSRYFAPHYNNNEDRATASALALIGPWLHQRYGLPTASVYQMYGSGNVLHYHCLDNRVAITGKALLGF